MNPRAIKLGLFILGLLVLSFLVTLPFQAPAGPPAVFADGTTFEDAVVRSQESGKPILVLATADWCPPCRAMKGSTLRDDRVESAIRERTIPVYLDLTDPAPQSIEAQVAQQLHISSLPTLVLWGKDGELARRSGMLQAVEMLTFLEAH